MNVRHAAHLTLAGLVASALVGCGSATPAMRGQDGYVTSIIPGEPPIPTIYGQYARLLTYSSGPINGELIAIDEDGLFILVDTRTVVRVSRDDLYQLWFSEEDRGTGAWWWGAAGAVSTVNHGFFLVVSFPLWALSTPLLAARDRRDRTIDASAMPQADLAAFARFPVGLPPTWTVR